MNSCESVCYFTDRQSSPCENRLQSPTIVEAAKVNSPHGCHLPTAVRTAIPPNPQRKGFHMMRTSLVLAAAVCLTGCGEATQKSSADAKSPATGAAETTNLKLVTFHVPGMV